MHQFVGAYTYIKTYIHTPYICSHTPHNTHTQILLYIWNVLCCCCTIIIAWSHHHHISVLLLQLLFMYPLIPTKIACARPAGHPAKLCIHCCARLTRLVDPPSGLFHVIQSISGEFTVWETLSGPRHCCIEAYGIVLYSITCSISIANHMQKRWITQNITHYARKNTLNSV